MFEPFEIQSDVLDFNYAIFHTLTIVDTIDWSTLHLQQGDIVLKGALHTIIATYRMWHSSELRELANAHELHLRARETTMFLVSALVDHTCNDLCPITAVILRAIQRPRPQERVDRARAALAGILTQDIRPYTQVSSETERRDIIQEWQQAEVIF